jgi:hypothetical protein
VSHKTRSTRWSDFGEAPPGENLRHTTSLTMAETRNGAAVRPGRPATQPEEENIFLFIPNLIGASPPSPKDYSADWTQATLASFSP